MYFVFYFFTFTKVSLNKIISFICLECQAYNYLGNFKIIIFYIFYENEKIIRHFVVLFCYN